MIEALGSLGFKYGGDTGSESKAYTDIKEKKIFIKKNKTDSEALLSLVYELTNASNTPKLETVYKNYLQEESSPDIIKATKYAHEILHIEAYAVYTRSCTAIHLHLESSVKNPKYLEITRLHKDDQEKAVEALYLEMIENGTVHNGKKKAVDHYIEQYFQQTTSKIT